MGYEDEYEAGGSFLERCNRALKESAAKEPEPSGEVTSTSMEPENGRWVIHHFKGDDCWTTYKYD